MKDLILDFLKLQQFETEVMGFHFLNVLLYFPKNDVRNNNKFAPLLWDFVSEGVGFEPFSIIPSLRDSTFSRKVDVFDSFVGWWISERILSVFGISGSVFGIVWFWMFKNTLSKYYKLFLPCRIWSSSISLFHYFKRIYSTSKWFNILVLPFW